MLHIDLVVGAIPLNLQSCFYYSKINSDLKLFALLQLTVWTVYIFLYGKTYLVRQKISSTFFDINISL